MYLRCDFIFCKSIYGHKQDSLSTLDIRHQLQHWPAIIFVNAARMKQHGQVTLLAPVNAIFQPPQTKYMQRGIYNCVEWSLHFVYLSFIALSLSEHLLYTCGWTCLKKGVCSVLILFIKCRRLKTSTLLCFSNIALDFILWNHLLAWRTAIACRNLGPGCDLIGCPLVSFSLFSVYPPR